MKSRQTPEIRLPGFTEDWKQRRLSELLEFSNGINAPKENYGKGRKMISVMDILADEPIIYENIRNSVEVNDITESKNKVENGDLVFVRSSEISNEVGWAKAYQQEKYALYSGFSIRGKKKSEFDAKFIELSINYSNRKQIESKAGGSTRFNVSQSILSSTVILEPSIEEQIEIGKLIKGIEATISLHQQELTTLKQTKQGFLQKMFPKEGAYVPEVRFPGFTGDWDQHKLSDITKIITKGTTPKDRSSEGDINFIKVENIDSGSGAISVTSKVSKEEHEGYLKRSQLELGDILFSIAGTLGRVTTVNDDVLPANTNQALAIIRLNEGNVDFIATYLKGKAVEDYIRKNPTIGAQPNLSLQQVGNLTINYPNIREQEKIGAFFKQLDDTIALYQRELDALKETKKAFLQKMFA
ncbi:restriction endonuclease subunit S [Priestia megaterium]